MLGGGGGGGGGGSRPFRPTQVPPLIVSCPTLTWKPDSINRKRYWTDKQLVYIRMVQTELWRCKLHHLLTGASIDQLGVPRPRPKLGMRLAEGWVAYFFSYRRALAANKTQLAGRKPATFPSTFLSVTCSGTYLRIE